MPPLGGADSFDGLRPVGPRRREQPSVCGVARRVASVRGAGGAAGERDRHAADRLRCRGPLRRDRQGRDPGGQPRGPDRGPHPRDSASGHPARRRRAGGRLSLLPAGERSPGRDRSRGGRASTSAGRRRRRSRLRGSGQRAPGLLRRAGRRARGGVDGAALLPGGPPGRQPDIPRPRHLRLGGRALLPRGGAGSPRPTGPPRGSPGGAGAPAGRRPGRRRGPAGRPVREPPHQRDGRAPAGLAGGVPPERGRAADRRARVPLRGPAGGGAGGPAGQLGAGRDLRAGGERAGAPRDRSGSARQLFAGELSEVEAGVEVDGVEDDPAPSDVFAAPSEDFFSASPESEDFFSAPPESEDFFSAAIAFFRDSDG